MTRKKKPRPKKKPDVEVQEWIISRNLANPAATMKAAAHHIQVAAKDKLSGFVIVPDMIQVAGGLLICRGKTPTGLDHFSLNLGNAVTFTLVGRIEYRGDWAGIPA